MQARLNPEKISRTDKAILMGLYLSRFDEAGLKRLGFDTFTEAFNVLGLAVDAPRGSIKNYRDEFDPLFPNRRKGWHKRPRRENCLKVLEEYGELDFELFTRLVEAFAGDVADADEPQGQSQFANRLITGKAAERYFEMVHREVPEFQGCLLEDTTLLGCGYDFRLSSTSSDEFLAIEVKGLKGKTGGISLTPREYAAAEMLRHRFFLFVVKNFEETPFHEIFCDPLTLGLNFRRVERTVVQTSWLVNI
jgi:hypothetical protein